MNDPKKPNVIWIFGDQHRQQAMSNMGDPNVSTPAMDRMTMEGVNFRGAIANNPWCCPFRFMLLSGQYSHKGVYKTPMPMDPKTPIVSDYLKESGYHTMYVGKWHLNGRNDSKIVPKDRRGRFDTWIGYENNNSQYDTHVHGHTRAGVELDEYRLPTYETDALTDIFIDQLCAHVKDQSEIPMEDKEPFFGILSVQPPHTPNVAPREYMENHRPGDIEFRANVPPVDRVRELASRELAGYYAQIENLDMNLDRVRFKLKELGIEDNTVVMFFSDHGDCMGSHGYREKSSPWEESIRVPFIWATGSPYRNNQRFGMIDKCISCVDIAPTTLGMCGIEKPEQMQGFDYSDYRFRNVQTPLPNEPDSVYIQQVVRKKMNDGIDRAWRGVVTQDGWKYVCIPGAPFVMFNLNEDPYEMNNLAFNQRFIAKRTELQNRLARWIEETEDTFELPEL